MASITASCSHRLTRRSLPVVHCALSGQCGQMYVQYVWNIQDLEGHLLLRDKRMVFVKDTPPEVAPA